MGAVRDFSGSIADTRMDQPVTSLTILLDFWDFCKPDSEGLEESPGLEESGSARLRNPSV